MSLIPGIVIMVEIGRSLCWAAIDPPYIMVARNVRGIDAWPPYR